MLEGIYQPKNSSSAIIFGKLFNADVACEWMRNNWNLPYCCVMVYLISIFGIQRIMQSRKAYELKGPQVVWNAFLACYSMFATYSTFSRYIPFLKRHGLSRFLCDNSATTDDSFATLVAFTFALSKIWELGDTFFIVLRKRHLPLLHWYHHMTVLLVVWRGGMEGSSIGQFFGPVNLLIHSLMYTYFALKALEIKVPKFVSMMITSMNILQMLSALVVSCFAYIQKRNGQMCHASDGFLNFAGIIYMSYAILFIEFFVHAYVRVSKQRSRDVTKVE